MRVQLVKNDETEKTRRVKPSKNGYRAVTRGCEAANREAAGGGPRETASAHSRSLPLAALPALRLFLSRSISTSWLIALDDFLFKIVRLVAIHRCASTGLHGHRHRDPNEHAADYDADAAKERWQEGTGCVPLHPACALREPAASADFVALHGRLPALK